MIVCKKCGYQRKPSDTAPDWQCPACHAAYAKVGAKRIPLPPDQQQDSTPTTAPAISDLGPLTLGNDDKPRQEPPRPNKPLPPAPPPQSIVPRRYDPPSNHRTDPDEPMPVVVTDIQIRFWSLVVLMVKIAFAAIPAVILIVIIWMVIFLVFGSVLIAPFMR